MDFYDSEENNLMNDFIYLNQRTSDIMQQDNINSKYILSKLNEFKTLKRISPELMNEFIITINQKIIWENIIEFNDQNVRVPFALLNTVTYDTNVPDDYYDTYEHDSIVDATIKFLPRYIQQKYQFFDFSPVNNIIERMQTFDVSKYLIKLFVILETLLPLSLSKFFEEVMEMLGDLTLQEKINKIKDKAYIGMLWNMSEAYLSKCDPDIHSVFINQSWDFIQSYINQNI